MQTKYGMIEEQEKNNVHKVGTRKTSFQKNSALLGCVKYSSFTVTN